jgi:flagellar biogenesis protein FliO
MKTMFPASRRFPPLARPARRARRVAPAVGLVAAILLLPAAACRGDDPAAPLPPLPAEPMAEPATRPAMFEAAASAPIDRPLPLRQPAAAAEEPATGSATAVPSVPRAGNWTLLLAIAAAFGVLAMARLRPFRNARGLPADVFEVLGEASLGGQHAVRVVRFGPRTLLVAVSSAGCQTLAELTDPQATERIVAACSPGRAVRPVPASVAKPRPRPVSAVRPDAAGEEAA